MRTWCRTPDGAALLSLLAVAVLLRLPLLPFHGFFGDLRVYVHWAGALRSDVLHFYSHTGSNYPPLLIYIFGVMCAAYEGVGRALGVHPVLDVARSPLFAAYMKLPVLLSDLASTTLIYQLARRVARLRWALIAAASYALSPAVLFDGVLWAKQTPSPPSGPCSHSPSHSGDEA